MSKEKIAQCKICNREFTGEVAFNSLSKHLKTHGFKTKKKTKIL